ncbi:unnamed protein product [Phytophthora lilii]|uniref:Unnamed protein product n=1 Tax=Phytophthora lilii TaxID=2077276 RepID=A0A9W6WM80_9STRA|nr:unnamed protein product [Phytophthora lilii]
MALSPYNQRDRGDIRALTSALTQQISPPRARLSMTTPSAMSKLTEQIPEAMSTTCIANGPAFATPNFSSLRDSGGYRRSSGQSISPSPTTVR